MISIVCLACYVTVNRSVKSNYGDADELCLCSV